MTIPKVRKRKKKPKVKTGCITCRQRHLKCGEERPACKRCVTSNRECVGLPSLEPPKPSRILPKQPTQTVCLDLQSRPSIAALRISDRDAYAYDFFRRHTVKILPGSSWNLSWERLALQAGDNEPAVIHAAIALGSIHRAMGSDNGSSIDSNQYDLAVMQYSKAIHGLQAYLHADGSHWTDTSVEVVLLIILIFFCFELLHNESALANVHLRNGLRILYERTRRSEQPLVLEMNGKRLVKIQASPTSNIDILMQAFVRLGADLTTAGNEEPYLSPIYDEQIPATFFSIDEAMVSLDAIAVSAHELSQDIVSLASQYLSFERADFDTMDEDMRNCLSSAYSRSINIGPILEARLGGLKARLLEWKAACDGLSMSEQRPSGHLLCQIQFFYIWFIVTTRRDSNEMLVDRFSNEFENIVDLVEQYVSLHQDTLPRTTSDLNVSTSQIPGRTGHLFTVGTDVVPCVGMIAFKARSTAIRRRCLNILRKINLQGVMDSGYLAAFIQIAADLEEDRARAINKKPPGVDLICSEICEEARLIELELSPMNFRTERPNIGKTNIGRMVYVERRSGSHDLHIGQEVFTVERLEWTKAMEPNSGHNFDNETTKSHTANAMKHERVAHQHDIDKSTNSRTSTSLQTTGNRETEEARRNHGYSQYFNHRRLAGFKDGPSFSQLLMFTHRTSGTFGGGQVSREHHPAEATEPGRAITDGSQDALDLEAVSLSTNPHSRSTKAYKMVRRQRSGVDIVSNTGRS